MNRQPAGSIDVRHVPAPKPEYFWPFTEGEVRVLAARPSLKFRLDEVYDGWLSGTALFEEKEIHGELDLHRSFVIARLRNGEPAITLTLRKIQAKTAYLQVTVNPSAGQVVSAQ